MRTTAFFLLLALIATACAEPEPETDDRERAVMSGAYRPKSDVDTADIRLLELGDESRYQLVPKGCLDADCVEVGTFAIDRAHDRLDLDPDGDRAAYSLPLVVRATRPASSLRTANLVGGGSNDSLVTEGTAPLVSGVELVGREFELVQSSKNKQSHAGSASENNLTVEEWKLRKEAQEAALANCSAAQKEVPANGANHCKPGNYIWGNRLVNTVAATACEKGYVWTTCTTIITITTTTVGG